MIAEEALLTPLPGMVFFRHVELCGRVPVI
jgi:hypothetical protein